jgi:hypothetical protein
MALDLAKTWIYHITDIDNLPSILAEQALLCDMEMAHRHPVVIGYKDIKQRRLTEIRVDCRDYRFVGEFVPFYFCPRSPMLLTINSGNTGRPKGCQRSIVHLVSSVAIATGLEDEWAVSDGNAGSFGANFYATPADLEGRLDWTAIRANDWRGKTHQKMAEFLVWKFFPWSAVLGIGCYDAQAAQRVQALLKDQEHQPKIVIRPKWYY